MFNPQLNSVLISSVLVACAVLIHYEVLHRLTLIIPRLPIRPRFRVVFGVFGSLIAHIIEVWIFAIGYFLMIKNGNFGNLQGNFDGSFLDCIYFSFTTYTSLGLGDIEPLGSLRFLVGLEALTGLVLITWSASFMFIEMKRFWDKE